MHTMRLALPEDVLVRFVKPHATTGCQSEEILIVYGVERRMPLQKVGNSIANDSGFHAASFVRAF